MGRRSTRDSYTSKGERRNVSRRWLKLASKDRDDKLYNQWDAFVKGKKVMLTIPNPNKNETLSFKINRKICKIRLKRVQERNHRV